jgi:phage host-nuclease inhibitor protein Gam
MGDSNWKSRAIPADANWKSRAMPVPETADQDPGILNSVVSNVAAGGTMGFDDELAGALSVVGRALGIDNLGGKIKDIHLSENGPTLDTDKLKQAYTQNRDSIRGLKEQTQDAHPWISGASQIGGMIANPYAAVDGLAGMAGLGAVQGLGDSTSNSVLGMAGDTAIGGLVGGVTGAVTKAAAPYIGDALSAGKSALGDAGEWIAQKAGKTLAGVPEDVTSSYLSNPAKYAPENVKSLEAIKDQVDANSSRLSKTRQAALDAADKTQAEYKSAVDEKTRELQDLFHDSRDAVGSAKEELNKAIRAKREELDEAMNKVATAASVAHQEYQRASTDLMNDLKSTKPTMGAVDAIQEAIGNLGGQVSKGSANSFDILDDEGVTVAKKHFVKLLNDAKASLEIDGVAPAIPGPELSTYNNLGKAIDSIRENYPDKITGSGIKKTIQQLDSSIGWDTPNPSGAIQDVKQMIREGLDKTIKNKSPDYATQMETVARQTGLLSTLNKQFGNPQQIMSRIMELPNEQGQFKQQLLNKLSEETGMDVNSLLKEYNNAQLILKDPVKLAMTKEQLPEYNSYLQAEKNNFDASTTPYRRNLKAQEMAKSTDEYSAYQQAQDAHSQLPDNHFDRKNAARAQVDSNTDFLNRIDETQRTAAGADNAYQNGYVSDSRSEPLIKRFLSNNPSIEDQRLVEQIHPGLRDDIDRLRVQNSFNKTDTQGARKTLLGTAVGGAAGFLLGGPMGAVVGAGGGSALGQVADRYAGQGFKAVLDGSVSLSRYASELGPYAQVLANAATRGPQALAATHYVLQTSQPDYRKRIDAINGNADK